MKRWLVWVLVFATLLNVQAFAFSFHDEEMEQLTLVGAGLPGPGQAAAHEHHHYCNHSCHAAAHAVAFVAFGWLGIGVALTERHEGLATRLTGRSIAPPVHPPDAA